MRVGDIDVFLLGAGRPATGSRPSALKHINLASCALDWQLAAIDDAIASPVVNFLGGYQVQSVIERYPHLNFTVVADWSTKSILHTLLAAPFRDCPALICYSDTVFRPQVMRELLAANADIVICIDSLWRRRYDERTSDDLKSAETIDLGKFANSSSETEREQTEVEFTGLMLLSQLAVGRLAQANESAIGRSLIDAINYLAAQGLSVAFVDADGEWAEFNSPADIAHFVLGTKAETLARLENIVRKSEVGRQVAFSVDEWQQSQAAVLDRITALFPETQLIVRSSAKAEDSWDGSNAGGHDSVLGVSSADTTQLRDAIGTVIGSYSCRGGDNQVLVQEMLDSVACSGVVFTRGLETGAPYYRINFDDESMSTESVTSGAGAALRTVLVSRQRPAEIRKVEPELSGLMEAVVELEQLLGYDKLDIEFAIDTSGTVHIFQVRPITVDHSDFEIEDEEIFASLDADRQKFIDFQTGNPFTAGTRTAFGVMPDWNPAEIIGTRPGALAYSLYRSLITDEVWARQRAEYGYRDVRPHNLIVAFSGQPYVDIRASLNSFIPASISADHAERLVDAYLDQLRRNPDLHDKLEFDVAFTVLSPCFRANAETRLPNETARDRQDIDALEAALRQLTNRALRRLESDIAPVRELARRRTLIESAELPNLHKAITLIEDCRQLGTPAFAHAARAGFVATTFLNDFVAKGVISERQRQQFLAGIQTVTSQFETDLGKVRRSDMSMREFIDRYGHLRPGTYDITVPSYREDAERYLAIGASSPDDDSHESCPVGETQDGFMLLGEQRERIRSELQSLGISIDPQALFNFMRDAIRQREEVKFIFTQNLSSALDCLVQFGKQQGVSRNDLACARYEDFRNLQNGVSETSDLRDAIARRKQAARVCQMIDLPELIFDVDDMFCFERRRSQPNFVTTKVIEAPGLYWSTDCTSDLSGKIICITQADPGYDWLFVHGIVGLVTQYGGANSHMAIRSAELGLPAAIGVGERIFESLRHGRRIRLDCNTRKIEVVA